MKNKEWFRELLFSVELEDAEILSTADNVPIYVCESDPGCPEYCKKADSNFASHSIKYLVLVGSTAKTIRQAYKDLGWVNGEYETDVKECAANDTDLKKVKVCGLSYDEFEEILKEWEQEKDLLKKKYGRTEVTHYTLQRTFNLQDNGLRDKNGDQVETALSSFQARDVLGVEEVRDETKASLRSHGFEE